MTATNELAAELIAQKHALRTTAILKWAKEHDVDLVLHGWHLSKSNSKILEDILNNTTLSIQNIPRVTGSFLPNEN